MFGRSPRGDFARLAFGQYFLFGFRTRLTFDFKACATFALGLLAHFGFDQRLRLRLNLGLFFGGQLRVHFGFDTGAIGSFVACARLKSLAIRGFSLLTRFGFGFGRTPGLLFGLEAGRHLGGGLRRSLGLRFCHPARFRFDTRFLFRQARKLFRHFCANTFFLIGQHGFSGDFGTLFRARFRTRERFAFSTQLFFEHPTRLFARLCHHGSFDFRAALLVDLDAELFLHLRANLCFDFFLKLMPQIALRRIEFFLLLLGRRFGLHALRRQCFCLRFGFGARLRQRQHFSLGLRARGRQGALMFRFFFELLAREAIARIRQGIALFLFGSEFRFEFNAGIFSGRLRTLGFLDRALFGFAFGARFNLKARTNLCFAFGACARVDLRFFARGREGGFQRFVAFRWWRWRGIDGRRGRRTLYLIGGGRRTVLRGLERGGRRRIENRCRFLWRGKVKIVVFAAEVRHWNFLLDFEYFDEPVFLQRRERFFGHGNGKVRPFGNRGDV